jgi:LysM repeat protein
MRRIILVLILVCLVSLPSVGLLAQSNGTTYTVQPGDNLFRISLKFGVSVQAIAQANGIANPALIFSGQVLQIPGATGTVPTSTPVVPGATPVPTTSGTTYTVQSGDTLTRIAARFSTTVLAIAQANGIANPNLIFVGQVLNIVGGTGGAATPVPTVGPNGPPPANLTGFEYGGQILNDPTGATKTALDSAKMTWIKRQIAAGDGNGSAWISQAHSAGYKILLGVLGDINSVTNSAYMDSYATYVAGLAQSGADAIEVWNEMNLDNQWPTGQISPVTYVQLLSKSYNAIKAAHPSTIVISGAPAPTGAEGAFGLAHVWNDDHYYSGMAAAGAAQFADCIGVHYNEGIVSPVQVAGDPRDNYPTRYFPTMLNRGLASFPGKQACFTELGYLSPEGYGALPSNFAWAANTTVAEQAAWLSQAIRQAYGTGRVRLVIVFNIDSTNYSTDPQAGYAMIRPGGSCPACSTVATALQ